MDTYVMVILFWTVAKQPYAVTNITQYLSLVECQSKVDDIQQTSHRHPT